MYIYIYFLLSFIVYSIQVFLVPCYFRSIFVMRSQDISLYYIFTYFSGLLGFWFFFFFLNLRVLFKKFDVYKYLISYFFENRILILIFISISIYFPMFFFFFPFSLYIRGIDGILEILERIQNSGIKGGDERERERERVRFAIFDRSWKSSVSLLRGTCKNSVDQGLELHVG